MGFCQICIYANSTTNPIIYNVCNENFRDWFRLYFGHCLSVTLGSRTAVEKTPKKVVVNCNGFVQKAPRSSFTTYNKEQGEDPVVLYVSTV